ncbi:MAG: hypothetical protein OEY23_16620, partial [Acidimicrobiia bacterium]|nr:hypothetical protein [Acidimicrobiia bacterium]
MERSSGRRLLVWDAPNMDMCLSEVIGERATAETRPNLDAVLAWMRTRCAPGDLLEACIFVNVPPGFEIPMSHWVAGLRQSGFAVFAKPKLHKRDDIDAEMLRHIRRRHGQGTLAEVVVASHDGKAFAAPLEELAGSGLAVTVLGYRERDVFASASDAVVFVDIEDLSGVFERPLPRTNLFDLPAAGRWFEPFVDPLGDAPEPTAPPRSEARPLPTRGAVLALLADATRQAASEGAGGLPLRDAGQLLRDAYPEFVLAELGFSSVVELVEAVVDAGGFELVRRAGSHLLVPLSPAAARPTPDTARSGPPAPVSGPPAPVSGPPAPVSGPPAPVSGPPAPV